MQKFATVCALAISASAVDVDKFVGARGTMQMNIDNYDGDREAMPQGDGQDHTLWSWGQMNTNGENKVKVTATETERVAEEEAKLREEISTFWENQVSHDVDRQLNCELHRREELNLYYQCTQNTYNHFSLDHFGGEMRSFPRWISEFKRCNMMLAEAECSTLTDNHEHNGETYKCFEEPCTQITLPMPEIFGPEVVVPPTPTGPTEPTGCGPLPDISMLSTYRFKGDTWPLNNLIRDRQYLYCIVMKYDEGSTTEGTITAQMLSNYEPTPHYNVRMNPTDCTIDIKSINADHYTEGRKLQPYGAPFDGYDAYSFEYAAEPAEKYDAKIGYCECNTVTGACEGHFDKEVEDGFM